MSIPRVRNVLFLCTGNSARSILAEALLNRLGAGRFHAYSAGSHPNAAPNPFALALLREGGYDVSGMRSKSWTEFVGPEAPTMDLIVTVCDSAATEPCPLWPGHPLTVHWGLPDPVAAAGDDADRRHAFVAAHVVLRERIAVLVALQFQTMDAPALRRALDSIGRIGAP